MKKLLLAESKANISSDKLTPVLCFDGMPITAHFISTEIGSFFAEKQVQKIIKEK